MGNGARAEWQAAKTANKGFLGRVGGAVKGALGMPVGTTAGTAGTQVATALGKPVTLGQVAPPGFVAGTQVATALGKPVTLSQTAPPGFTEAVGMPIADLKYRAPAGTAGTQVATALGKPVTLGQTAPPGFTEAASTQTPTIFSRLKQPASILGATSLAASTIPKTPQFQMPSSVGALQEKLLSEGALTDIGKQAQLELGNILKTPAEELYPTANDAYYQAALRRTRENYAEAQKQLDAAYNLAGMYGSGEHLAEKAKLQEELARTESGLAAQTEQRRFELARTAKYQAVQDALGVDRQTMDDLVGLSGLDVQTAAMMYGADVADVQSIREALGTVGAELLVRGIAPNQFGTGGLNINIGQ